MILEDELLSPHAYISFSPSLFPSLSVVCAHATPTEIYPKSAPLPKLGVSPYLRGHPRRNGCTGGLALEAPRCQPNVLRPCPCSDLPYLALPFCQPLAPSRHSYPQKLGGEKFRRPYPEGCTCLGSVVSKHEKMCWTNEIFRAFNRETKSVFASHKVAVAMKSGLTRVPRGFRCPADKT